MGLYNKTCIFVVFWRDDENRPDLDPKFGHLRKALSWRSILSPPIIRRHFLSWQKIDLGAFHLSWSNSPAGFEKGAN